MTESLWCPIARHSKLILPTYADFRAMNELERFFEATDALEDKQLEFLGWEGTSKAIKTIEKYSR